MNTAKVKTTKLSICDCGFPALNDGIGLGTEYVIRPSFRRGHIICGGCGKRINQVLVFAEGREPGDQGGWLPWGIFDL